MASQAGLLAELTMHFKVFIYLIKKLILTKPTIWSNFYQVRVLSFTKVKKNKNSEEVATFK